MTDPGPHDSTEAAAAVADAASAEPHETASHATGERGVGAQVTSDEEAMEIALDLARTAAAAGEVPVGAVVVVGGEVIAARANERERTADPTAHAEVLALRDAAVALGNWRLSDATLVVSLEPCPMCAGAAWAARVGRIVFGAADPRAGATGSLYNFAVDERLNHESAVVAGVRAAESAELLSEFFAARRPSD